MKFKLYKSSNRRGENDNGSNFIIKGGKGNEGCRLVNGTGKWSQKIY